MAIVIQWGFLRSRLLSMTVVLAPGCCSLARHVRRGRCQEGPWVAALSGRVGYNSVMRWRLNCGP
jgi:hypothetical protein